MTDTARDPHAGQPVLRQGAPWDQARAAMVLIHGRGATAQDILALSAEFRRPEVAYVAPQAAGGAWYPQRFLLPVAYNEPWLGSALQRLTRTTAELEAAGIPAERLFVLGFSQGACLALEFAARFPRRYGGVFALSGALIENGDQPRTYGGSLSGTPVFLGCSDVDPHIPADRVARSADVLRRQGAAVTLRFYPGLGHTVTVDEIRFIRQMLAEVVNVDHQSSGFATA